VLKLKREQSEGEFVELIFAGCLRILSATGNELTHSRGEAG
jgi:hypothetical protein